MKPPIGFVITTHNNPAQILFLCEQLNSRFDRPPISIHHDFGQSPLNTAEFPANVSFVQDWINTGWGRPTLGFTGENRALRDLYRNADPDWFVNLSGSDFPIEPANGHPRRALFTPALFDGYIDHRRIVHSRVQFPAEGLGAENSSHPAWVTLDLRAVHGHRLRLLQDSLTHPWMEAQSHAVSPLQICSSGVVHALRRNSSVFRRRPLVRRQPEIRARPT